MAVWHYLQAIPYTWGLMRETFDKYIELRLTLENPTSEICLPVSRVRWHPSETNCWSGSRRLCI